MAKKFASGVGKGPANRKKRKTAMPAPLAKIESSKSLSHLWGGGVANISFTQAIECFLEAIAIGD
jgi:hypothetical protein